MTVELDPLLAGPGPLLLRNHLTVSALFLRPLCLGGLESSGLYKVLGTAGHRHFRERDRNAHDKVSRAPQLCGG